MDKNKQPYATHKEDETEQYPKTSVKDAHYRGDSADELSALEEANHDIAAKELGQQNENGAGN
ncbi:hypothetical protein [Alteribacter keqinensis]|uniref:Uncharacterized protein n=1 Tax=Alteribacter keqinensis TaxID=2483800 RepID=A0A3M7TR31_9BACI|nr:hypothetical protein [Alteribacter keqinensis]RNA66810.1 hypothetical protein EBO34_16520 [Alteribacter keqinensis]